MTKLMLGVMVAALSAAGTAVAQPAKPDLPALAEKIVTKAANVKEGEIIQITAGPSDLAFAEELAVAVKNHGAFPLITYWSEAAQKKWLATSTTKYDSKTDAAALTLAKNVNANIFLPPIRDTAMFEKVADRAAAWDKANQVINDTLVKRSVRNIDLSNGLAPSPARAKEYGITEAEMTQIWWAGLGADYSAVEQKGAALKDLLSKGAELRITHPNGTDLKMRVKGRKVLVSDGVLTDAEVKAGTFNIWLPAGEVLVTPVPGTAEGKLVDDRWVRLEKEITGITAEIKGGKITSITAKSGWDVIKPFYDKAGAGKDEITGFDLGINPSIKATPKMKVFAAAGLVSITTGMNTFMGGTNKEPFMLLFMLPGATVTLDGKVIVDNGSVK